MNKALIGVLIAIATLNGGEGTKVMAHAMVIAEFEEVKDGNK